MNRTRQPINPILSEETGLNRLIDSLSLADYMYFGVLSSRELRDGGPILDHIQENLQQILEEVITIHHLRHPPLNPLESAHLTRELIDPLLDDFKDEGYQLFVIDALWDMANHASLEGARFFRRLNELRNTIMDRLPGPLLLLTTTDLAVTFAREAPDFWSVRSVWEEIKISADKPEADFTDVHHKDLAEALEQAHVSHKEKLIKGLDTKELDRKILGLKRQLRDGGTFRTGDILGHRYRLVQHIGSGGFATVWKSYDLVGKQMVAVKILHAQHSEDRTRRERFFRGARKMADLNHPNIVAVIEAMCEEGGIFYFVMEYAEGGDLEQKVRRDGPLPVKETVRIILDIGDGLANAHSRGVIHRDVKPSNVLFTGDDRAKLTDFDLVRAMDTTGGTRTGALGTFLYAAPESMTDASSVGPQADVYGLAMTTLFSLKGKLELDVFRDSGHTIEKLNISADMKRALAKGLSWDLDQRFGTITYFCEAIQESMSKAQARLSKPQNSTEFTLSRSPCSETISKRDLLTCEHDWVRLAPGAFTMGDDRAGVWEQPAHRIQVTHFLYLSRMPVTNRAYRLFLESSGYRNPTLWYEEGWQWLQLNDTTFEEWYKDKKNNRQNYFTGSPEWYRPGKAPRFWNNPDFNQPEQPVVGVNWFEAMAFCRWLALFLKKRNIPWLPKAYTIRLLTEAEWEYAAKGCAGRSYPWGHMAPDTTCANFGAKIGRTTPIDAYPRGSTPEGCTDMAGNVWEWCLDHWDPFAYRKRKSGVLDPLIGKGPPVHVLRGGSWDDLALSMRCSARMGLLAATRDKYFGFRCCIVPSG